LKKRPGSDAVSRKHARVRAKRPIASGAKVTLKTSGASILGEISGTGVFLVGFMGAGKSSVGRALGQRLNWLFEDLDDRIERREGRKIADIFRDSGEPAFRRAEQAALRQVLEELSSGIARIVALGGGAFAAEGNKALLRAAGVPTVFLDAPVEELWRRCRSQADEGGTERPLLQSFEQFRTLHLARRSHYLKARVKVKTEGREVDAIAAEIAKKLALKEITMRTQQGESE
jgi:shikimate kinase